jgi:hypothetical protein
MDAINAITNHNGRNQRNHCEMRPSNATRKAVVISLKATRRPLWRMWQGHCEGNVSITTILIPQWQVLPQGCQSLQSVYDECKLQRFADQRRSQGSYAQSNNGDYRHRQHGQREQQQQQLANSNQTIKKTKPLWHVRHSSRAQQLLDKQQIKSPGRAGDTIFSDERTNASKDNKKYHFVGIPKIKRMLVVCCSGPDTATSSRVQSAKIILYGFPWQGSLDL